MRTGELDSQYLADLSCPLLTLPPMKYLLCLVGLALAPLFLSAQPCQQVEVATDAAKTAVLQEYVRTCFEKHYFFEDKGVVKLVVYQDEQGLTRWHLSALVDDRYRAFPPREYAQSGTGIVLVYRGQADGSLQPIAGNTAARDSCVQAVVGSRVYAQTTAKQVIKLRNAQGKLETVPVTHMSGGNVHNEVIVRFNKDGTITKFSPV